MTQWSVATSPNDSNHCPITLAFLENRPVEPVTEWYNIKAAVWELYQANDAFNNIPEDVNSMDCESLLDDVYNRCYKAANNAVPKITIKNFFPKPYWTRELTESRKT